MTVDPSYISTSCSHWEYQIIYRMNTEGLYEEKKICLACKQEIRGY